jgi:uncharacterized protein (TIGR03435 family)
MTRTLASLLLAPLFSTMALHAQSFDVVSVKASLNPVGPDYNNRIAIGPSTFSGKNVTLKRLLSEAYGMEPSRISGGPKWLAEAEYDVEGKTEGAVSPEEMRKMLQTLLAERFHAEVHRETRELRTYELTVDKGGIKIRPASDGEPAAPRPGAFHFHGDLQQLADLISVQLTIPAAMDDPSRPSMASGPPIPVFNRTGLTGAYDLDVDLKLAAGIPAFNLWQAALTEFGLKLESRKGGVEVLVVDRADRVPVAN